MVDEQLGRRRERLAALLIGSTALLEVLLIAHHPIARAHEGDAAFAAIMAVLDANLAFHALLILIFVAQFLGLLLFAKSLGLGRPIVLTGLIFCVLAGMMLTFAMTFDGFVTYGLVSSCNASAQGCTAATAQSLRLVSATISAFSKVGFAAQCLGFAVLSAAMWLPGKWMRSAAAAGIVIALAPIGLIGAGRPVGPALLVQLLALMSAWGLVVAVVLNRGEIGRVRRSSGGILDSA